MNYKIALFSRILLITTIACNHSQTVIPQKKEHITSVKPDGPIVDKNEYRDVVYISKDTGKTWQPFANGIPADATVSCFSAKGNKIIASTEFHGVYIGEGNNNWKSVSDDLPDNVHIKAIEVMDSVIIIGTSRHGIFTSSDEGENWEQKPSELDAISVRCLITVNDNLFAGTDKGVYKSFDKGKTWKHEYGSVQINGFTQLNKMIYAGVVNGAIMTSEEGSAWRYIYGPNTLHDISDNGRYIYAMTLGGGLLRSDNDGVSWENANEGMGGLNWYTFEVKNMGADLFAAQWIGIYHSTDEGKTWNLIKGGLPDATAFTTLEVTKYGIVAGIGLRK